MARLDEVVNSERSLSSDDISVIRRQLEDSSTLVFEQATKSKQIAEENEILLRRREELESRLTTVEAEYEELLDKSLQDDQRADSNHSANIQDIKVSSNSFHLSSS